MSLQPGDALTAHNFGLQIDGINIDFIQEISGITMTQDVIEYQQVSAAGKPVIKKMPGASKAGQATVVRGATPNKVWDSWTAASRAGDMGSARKNASILINDFENNPVKRPRSPRP